jgi:hypothetical protein
MNNFAKLIETERGQVLAKLDSGDDGPEVRVFFNPEVEGIGVCSMAFNFKDEDHKKAKKLFDELTDKKLEAIAFKAMEQIRQSWMPEETEDISG